MGQNCFPHLILTRPGKAVSPSKSLLSLMIRKFANLPRFGLHAGKPNENFLNADLFASAFVKPCEPFKQNVGLLIFEFSKFYPADYRRGRDFVADLDRFLEQLPKGWPYGVEIRNKYFLR